jgi:carboxylesterase type B
LVLENPSREEPFLVQDPLDIIHSGNFEYVPLMIGCTTGETVPFITYRDDETEHNYEKIISWNFGYPRGSEENKSAVKAIKKFYFGHEEPSEIDFGRKCQVRLNRKSIKLTVVVLFSILFFSCMPTPLSSMESI